MGGLLGLSTPFSVTLAERDGWGSLIYLAFFVLAGVASALGKWKKRGQDKRDQKIADVEVELEAEILPEPAPARKVERPPPSVRPSTPQLPAARSMPPPPTSFPARPPVLPTIKSVPKAAPPTPHKRRRVTQEAPAQAKAAYQEQVAVAPPPRPRETHQRVTPKRSTVPPDVRVIRRLLADRTGQRAAIGLCEVLGPPIALRESHLER